MGSRARSRGQRLFWTAAATTAGLWACAWASAPRTAAAATCPQLTLVLDRSASMAEPLYNGGVVSPDSKWVVLREVMAPFLEAYDNRVRVGFTFLPGSGGGGGDKLGDTRPADPCTNGFVGLPPTYHAGPGITSRMAQLEPYGSTPTAATLRDLRSAPWLKDDTRLTNFALLVIDGFPSCDSADNDVSATTAALTDLRQAGVKTFVLALDLASDGALLNRMADAGGVPRKSVDPVDTDKFYLARTPAELTRVLDEIVEAMGGDTLADCAVADPDGGTADAGTSDGGADAAGDDGLESDGGCGSNCAVTAAPPAPPVGVSTGMVVLASVLCLRGRRTRR